MTTASKVGQHTSGPWKYHDFRPHGCTIYAPDCYPMANTSAGHHEDWVVPNPLGDDVAEANARLISAAPELLSALEAVMGTFIRERKMADPAMQAVIDNAYDVLCRAKGEANG